MIDSVNGICEIYGEEFYYFEPENVFNNGIIGVSEDQKHLVYSYDKLVEALKESEPSWSTEDAIEWLEYNTIRTIPYLGENRPIIVYPIDI